MALYSTGCTKIKTRTLPSNPACQEEIKKEDPKRPSVTVYVDEDVIVGIDDFTEIEFYILAIEDQRTRLKNKCQEK